METEDNIHMITPSQQMISSTVGALTTSIIVTPLDVVKIRLQAQQKNFYKKKFFLYSNGLMEHICFCLNGNSHGHLHHSNGTTIAIDPKKRVKWFNRSSPGHFNGTFDAFMKISRTEGILSLWSGLPPTLIMAVPATVIYFTVYDRFRASLWHWYGSEKQPIWIPVLCGASARCIAATVISPLEMVRTKMQSKNLSYKELSSTIYSLIRRDGYLSLWRGLGPTLLRDVPFSGVYWATYEHLKQLFGQREPTLQFSLIGGALAGSLAAVTTLPFDVAKTHRQIELGDRDSYSNNADKKAPQPLKKTSDILKTIYHREGISGLFSGIVPRVIKVAPSCAIMISCYEIGKQFFVEYNRKHDTSSIC